MFSNFFLGKEMIERAIDIREVECDYVTTTGKGLFASLEARFPGCSPYNKRRTFAIRHGKM